MLNTSVAEPEMTQEEFQAMRDFIHERSGIFFGQNKEYLLRNRLIKRMAEVGVTTYKDYFYRVKYDTSNKEFSELMNLVTTNETFFFRNEPQLLSFADEVLPMLLDQKRQSRGKTLKIWSAGCSTGEEAYTIAILILEKLGSLAGWNVEIIANDISEQVLQRARLGEYGALTLRNVEPRILERYFQKQGTEDKYRVRPELKALVKFSQINLNDQRKVAMLSGFDVVFCRNVMIYFSDEVKRQIVRGFYNALQPGGYLYIGHSETLHGISKAFKLVYFKNALVYHKEPSGVRDTDPGVTARCPAAAAGLTGSASTSVGAGAASGASRAIDLLSKIKPAATK